MPAILLKLLFIVGITLCTAPLKAQSVTELKDLFRSLDSSDMLLARKHLNNSIKSNKNVQKFPTTGASNYKVHNKITLNNNVRIASENCYDTSGRFSIKNDSVTYYVGESVLSRDGNLLIPGQFSTYKVNNRSSGGFLIKADTEGKVIWAKIYDSLHHVSQWHTINYYRLLELKDGSILLGGASEDRESRNQDVIFTKTDRDGNVLWTKDYYSRLWTRGSSGSADYFYLHQLEEDTYTGDVFINGPSWSNGIQVMRLNINDGSMVWSGSYLSSSNSISNRNVGIVVKQNEVLAFVTITDYKTLLGIYRLDKNTGDTLSTVMLTLEDTGPYSRMGILAPDPVVVMENGDIVISGRPYGFYLYDYDGTVPLYQGGIIVLDSDLNFRKGYSFRNHISGNGYNTRITVHPDGTGVFSMLEVLSGYSGTLITAHFNEQGIIKQRVRSFISEGRPSEPYFIQLATGKEMQVLTAGDSAINASKILFVKMNLSDTSSECMGLDIPITATTPVNYFRENHLYVRSIERTVFLERRTKTFYAAELSFDEPEVIECKQTSFCDSLSLQSEVTTTCANVPLLINKFKNQACGSPVMFSLDNPDVAELININDSVVQVTFRTAWEGYLYGSLNGCEAFKDSLYFKVFPSPEPLNLGPDLVICPGNKIVINAQPGYAIYEWQDGSTTDTLTVNAPGIYYVNVTDGCGHKFTDTITVTASVAIPLSIGDDLSICRGDQVTLTATDEFTRYEWSPAYNISATTGRVVNIFPEVDTFYTVRAEKMPGCFSFDTIQVKVNVAMPIQLGGDITMCQGETTTLDAGIGFDRYQWSNGAEAQFIDVTASGKYSVIGFSENGCKAYDTINVIVNPVPLLNLGGDSNICIGETKRLDAGSGFVQYKWSNGSASAAIDIQTIGSYWVEVIDNNHCKAADTVNILRILPKPDGFLVKDTAICSYGEINVTTRDRYNDYTWSTGSKLPSLIINRPGIYWLDVLNENGCKGRDTINVIQKECLKGLYVPSAFTPNGDGKNDYLKAMLFGDIEYFEFYIYNRYGQVVFRTNDRFNGWNGMVGGIMQNTGNFVWVCKYKLRGEEDKLEKGNVVLIR